MEDNKANNPLFKRKKITLPEHYNHQEKFPNENLMILAWSYLKLFKEKSIEVRCEFQPNNRLKLIAEYKSTTIEEHHYPIRENHQLETGKIQYKRFCLAER